jgi:3-methyladenine DNA glycosylase AlkD
MAMPGERMIAVLAADVREHALAAADRTVPTLRRVRRAVSQRLKAMEPTDVIDLALLLQASRDVPRWFSYELLHHHRGAMARLTETHLRQLGRGLAGWGEVDTFACYLAGPVWRERRIGDEVIHRWAVSADRWWRRVALVCTVALNNTARGGVGDAARTLAVCDIVKDDSDDMVVKALSWALRELARKEPQAVRGFLCSNRDSLAARVMREVRNKLDTGLKSPRSTASGNRHGKASESAPAAAAPRR